MPAQPVLPIGTGCFALLILLGVLQSASASEAPVVAPLQPTVENARLSALRDALAAGVPDAEAQFWSAVEVAGTPIVESTDEHPDEARITFLWKGTAKTRSVRLISGPQIISKFKNLGFRRLDGTDVWFLTLHVPRGWRVGYMLVENAEQRGYPKGGAWMAAARRDPLNRFRTRQDGATPTFDKLYSVFETPGVLPEPWLRRHPGVAAGVVTTRRLTSARLGTERTVDVYVPVKFGVAGERPAGPGDQLDGDD
jgi:enterochelin esterase family protein